MRCFSVLGPSKSGKTTLASALMSAGANGRTGSTPVGANLHDFSFMDDAWFGIDTPGSNEALTRAIHALGLSDIAVICVAPDPNQAVLAAPYIRAVEAARTPSIIFVNQIDEPKGRIRDVVSALQEYTEHTLVLRQMPIREDGRIVGAIDLISERAWRYREGEVSALVEIPEDAIDSEHIAHDELLEQLSEYDDWLLEELVENRQPTTEAVFAIAARTVKETRITPVLLGSALHGNGIFRLMKALRHEAPDQDSLYQRLSEHHELEVSEPFCATFACYYKPGLGKVTLSRCLSGTLEPGGRLGGDTIGGVIDPLTERQPSNATIQAGQVFSAVKADQLAAPAVADQDRVTVSGGWMMGPEPMFEDAISADNERDEAKLSDALRKLKDSDPSLEIAHSEDNGGLILRTQGPIHLRQALNDLSETFKVSVSASEPKAVYRETISADAETHYRHRKQSGGAGQFADVKIAVSPNARGKGFEFSEAIKGGAVPRNYIPAVEAGAREAMTKGPLGFPVIDVKVTLLDGQHHSVDSSDFAFKTAGQMGVQKALSEAHPVLMQPIYRVTCHLPSTYSGNLVPLISSLKGQVLGFEREDGAKGWDLFRAMLPGDALQSFARSLRSETQGIGYFEKDFDHFEEIYGKEADQIIARAAE